MKPHHGEINSLSSSDTTRLLEEGRFAHLGCYGKDEVYIVPITYAFIDGHIYAHSRPGKKIEMMRKNPRICIQIENIQDFFHWKSVIAWGDYEEVEGEAAIAAMRMLIRKILETEEGKRASSLEVDLTAQLETAILFRMKVQKITGRCEGFSN